MDFQSLARKELQALCKKNKIPANMTNVAMADALAALANVEGIEDIAKSASEEPQSVSKTPGTRRTRRNVAASTENEPESSLQVTRSRHGTRQKKEAEQEQKEIPETPGVRAGRRRATGTSIQKKVESQIDEGKDEQEKENVVTTRAYSTRRSTRLISDKKATEPVSKRGGRRSEAIKISPMSEGESENLTKKSISDVKEAINKDSNPTNVSDNIVANVDEGSTRETTEGAVSVLESTIADQYTVPKDVSVTNVSEICSPKETCSGEYVPEDSNANQEGLILGDASDIVVSPKESVNLARKECVGDSSSASQVQNEEASPSDEVSAEVPSGVTDMVLEHNTLEKTHTDEEFVADQENLVMGDSSDIVTSEEVLGDEAEKIESEQFVEVSNDGEEVVADQDNLAMGDASDIVTSEEVLGDEAEKIESGEFVEVSNDGEEFVADQDNLVTGDASDIVACEEVLCDAEKTESEEFVVEVSNDVPVEDASAALVTASAPKSSPLVEKVGIGEFVTENLPCENEMVELNTCSRDGTVSADGGLEKNQGLEGENPHDLKTEFVSEDEFWGELYADLPKIADSSSISGVWDFEHMNDSIQECCPKPETCNPDTALDGEMFDGIEDENEKADVYAPEERRHSRPCKESSDLSCDVPADIQLEAEISVTDSTLVSEKCDPVVAHDTAMDTNSSSGGVTENGSLSENSKLDTEMNSAIAAETCVENLSSEIPFSSAQDPMLSQVPSCLSPIKVTLNSGIKSKVTPLKSSNKKATPIQKMALKVFDDNKEGNNNSLTLRSSSKLSMVVAEEKDSNINKCEVITTEELNNATVRQTNVAVAEEKENNINKGKSITKKELSTVSLRQLKKMFKEKLTIGDNKSNIDNEKSLSEKTRPALQKIQDNCLVGGAEN